MCPVKYGVGSATPGLQSPSVFLVARRDRREVAALVHQDLGETGPVDGVERRHVRASRLAQRLDLSGLASAARHLVEGVEQPVGVTDEVEAGSGVVLDK